MLFVPQEKNIRHELKHPFRFEMSGTSARMRRMSAADRAAADKASEWIAQVRTG